jgi:hypothetical protein
MHLSRPFTILPLREIDESASRTSRSQFLIRTCERCGQLTTRATGCGECRTRDQHRAAE